MLWHPYKWRFCCSITHILEILPFVVCKSNLRGMGFRSLIVSAGVSSEDSGSALLDLFFWELCFSLVSPLWESCYSLASRARECVRGGGGGGGHTFCAAFSVFYSFFSSSPLFSFSFLSSFLPHLILPFHFPSA